MTAAADAMRDFAEAFADIAGAGQIIRKTRTTDPTNPTNTITTEKVYDASLWKDEPRRTYIEGQGVVQVGSQLYVDLLSLVDTDTSLPVNYIDENTGEPVLTVVTDLEDVAVMPDGTRVTLLANTGTNVAGVRVFGLHDVAR